MPNSRPTYPSTGGEYRFLERALGQPVALMFAWARTTVIQTGAIAAVAFVLGDYAQALFSLGDMGPAIYAAVALAALTAVNIYGTYQSKTAQNMFSYVLMASLGAIIAVGFIFGGEGVAAAPADATTRPALSVWRWCSCC